MSGELKFHDVAFDKAITTVTGSRALLLDIDEGTGPNERIGRKITIRRIQWRIGIALPRVVAAAVPPDHDIIRLIMFVDKQTNGALTPLTSILDPNAFRSLYPPDEQDRVFILKDWRIALNYGTLSESAGGLFSACSVNKQLDWSWHGKIDIEYSDPSGAIANITSNSLGAVVLSANAVIGMFSDVRISYTDH